MTITTVTRTLRLVFAGALWMYPARAAWSDPPSVPVAAPEFSKIAQPVVDAEGVPDVGPVQSARALSGARVFNEKGDVLGTIEDVGIDFGRGGVSAVFMKPVPGIDVEQKTMTVPIVSLDWTARPPEIVLRSMGGELPEKKVAEPDAPNAVVLMSAIVARPIIIEDADGRPAGRLVDFGLARQKGLVAYAVCELSGRKAADSLHPIPLTAFVVDDAAWRLDLPKDVIDATPTFSKDQFPDSLDRAWLEYVHVRYGRSPLGGVRFDPPK